MDKYTIIIRDLKLHCLIGIDKAEQYIHQVLLFDIDVDLARSPNDDHHPVLGYDVLIADVRRLLANQPQPFGLLENVVAAIATMVMDYPDVARVRLYCRKPKLFADVGEAGIILERERE